jgi:GntR family transcriptional repressor for pyruvate dehydrogenase complex
MAQLFSEIRPSKISEQIVEQVKMLIREGHLQPGQKLPPEKEFTQQLGVGRSSLREAINVLEALGYLEARKHKGVFVSSVSEPILNEPLHQILKEDQSKLPHLYDLRKDIELAASQKAAERRDSKDLKRLATCLNRMARDKEQHKLALQDDLQFHLAIAQATHNFLRLHVLKNIFEISNAYIDLVRVKIIGDDENIPEIYSQHEAIFKAIEAKRAHEARDYMETHLTWVETRISELFYRT